LASKGFIIIIMTAIFALLSTHYTQYHNVYWTPAVANPNLLLHIIPEDVFVFATIGRYFSVDMSFRRLTEDLLVFQTWAARRKPWYSKWWAEARRCTRWWPLAVRRSRYQRFQTRPRWWTRRWAWPTPLP